MDRLQLVELEDLPWVPKAIRDGGTDLLDLGFDRLGFYRALAPELVELLRRAGTRDVIDLCSGGGGGALSMLPELRAALGDEVTLTLTDRHPNRDAAARFAGRAGVRYHLTPVDATDVPAELQGVRTMFGAIHHFPPEGVRRVLSDAVRARAPIALVDVAASPAIRRAPLALLPLMALPNLAVLTVASLVATPFVRPFKLSRLLLTYVAPAIPALFAWDGTVSALRAYELDELLSIAREVGPDYDWSGRRTATALCVTGLPR